MQRPSRLLLVIVSFLSFVAIGLPGGALGVAWPSIRSSFALSLDAVGALLLAHTVGYLSSSFNNGRLISSLGLGSFLMISSAIGGIGLLGYALAPTWGIMVLCGLLAGIGGGAIDAGINTYFAANHGASLMNWLHAFFGLGATLGPVITTTTLGRGYSWRWSYVLIAIFQGLIVICFAFTLRGWRLDGQEPAEAGSTPSQVRALDTFKLPAVWLSILLFFIFTGLESSGGQWSYTLFTEARSIEPSTAGFWVSAYWASLTIGRILFGVAASRIGIIPLLRASMLGATCGAALIWWNPTQLLSFLGLALLGFSVAPIFPLSISNTPRQLGNQHAANAIGFQVAAASLGIAALPGLGGILAERLDLEIIGPFLLVVAIVMLLLHESYVRQGTRRERNS